MLLLADSIAIPALAIPAVALALAVLDAAEQSTVVDLDATWDNDADDPAAE